MNKFIVSTLAVAAIATSLLPAVAASSTPAAPAKTAAAAPVKCPSCGMPMSATKSAATPIPIYLAKSKRTVYCCAGCASGKKAAAYWKAHHKAVSVPM